MHEGLRERIDAAAERHEKAKRALVRDDGKAKYSIPEFQELEDVARREFEDSLSRLEDEIDGRVSRAEERLLIEQNRDPSSALSREELQEANARRAFVSDAAESLSPEALAERVKAVISSGDRAGQFLYLHHLRLKASEAAATTSSSPQVVTNRLTLEALVKELERALDPEAEARLAKAREEIAELQKVRDYSFLRKNGARDPVELHLNRAYGAAKW
jgi:hypothetical protein